MWMADEPGWKTSSPQPLKETFPTTEGFSREFQEDFGKAHGLGRWQRIQPLLGGACSHCALQCVLATPCSILAAPASQVFPPPVLTWLQVHLRNQMTEKGIRDRHGLFLPSKPSQAIVAPQQFSVVAFVCFSLWRRCYWTSLGFVE